MVRISGLVLVLVLASVALAQEKPLSQAELAKKPPYERLLKGDDAKKAAELEQSYNEYLNAEDWAEAKKSAQALLDLRIAQQGADHYEVTDVRQLLKNVEIRAKLTPDERRELAEANKQTQEQNRLYQQAQFRKAAELGEQVLATRKKLLGENHPDYATSLNNLGALYRSMGDYLKAKPLLLEAREIRQKLLGEDHPQYAQSLNNLAALYHSMGEYAKAEPLLLQTLQILKKLLGENHPYYALSLDSLAGLYRSMGESAKAEPLYLQVRAMRQKLLGDNHPYYAISLNNLAGLYRSFGESAKAELLLQECRRSYEMSRIARAGGFGRAIGGEGQNPYPDLATVSAWLNKPQQGFTMLERNLARAFLDVQAERRGLTFTPEQQARRTRIINELSPLDKRIGVLVTRAKLTEDETKELAEKIAVRSKLNVQLADLAAELSTQEVSDFASIQKAVSPGHALLTWVDVVGGQGKGQTQEHWACLVKSTGEPLWVKLPGFGPSQEQAIADNRLTQELRNKLATISSNPGEVSQLFEKLKAQRITPILPHLEGIHTIYAICVNQMAGIPIEPMLPDRAISQVVRSIQALPLPERT